MWLKLSSKWFLVFLQLHQLCTVLRLPGGGNNARMHREFVSKLTKISAQQSRAFPVSFRLFRFEEWDDNDRILQQRTFT
jgi:hypothetical protein